MHADILFVIISLVARTVVPVPVLAPGSQARFFSPDYSCGPGGLLLVDPCFGPRAV